MLSKLSLSYSAAVCLLFWLPDGVQDTCSLVRLTYGSYRILFSICYIVPTLQ